MLTETGEFLDSGHFKGGNALGDEGIFKYERINFSCLLCLLRMKYPVLARHAVVFSVVHAHLQEFPRLTFFYLCSKTEQRSERELALSDSSHPIRTYLW